MRLKQLEVYGFKSFANRIVFDFSKGLTVIVGPNGCGKSNVADSIRWIFGEMSAKVLRGSGMTDVIFSGTRNRRAYSFAEGTLTFTNEDRSMNINADEVSITRNLNRSGESQYFINGQQCRLTDIKLLLQGTGLGSLDYNMIQQGAVEKLISSDNKSRRAVFDEAAGISTYKYRRDRAARKLEKVDFALERLGDRVESTERELRSLKRRASAARRYHELTEEWKGKDFLLNQLKYTDVTAQLSEVSSSFDEINGKLIEYNTLEGKISAEVAKLEESVFNSEKKVNGAEKRKIDIQNTINQDENSIQFLSERIEEKRKSGSDRGQEIEEIKGRINTCERDIQTLTGEIAEIDSEVDRKRETLESKEKDLEEVRGEFSRIMEISEGKKASLEETFSQSSVTKNGIDTLSAERKALTTNQTELEGKLETLKTEKDSLESQFEKINSEIEHLEDDRGTSSRQLDNLIERKEKLIDEKEILQHRISDLNHALTRIDSRLHLLRDLEDKYEGISAGVKGILENLKNPDSSLTGIYGMVADFIRVKEEDEEIIEIALGDSVQNIIVENTDDALKAIKYLKEKNLGKATFMPEETYHNGFSIHEDLMKCPGVESSAMDLVRFKEEHKGIVKHLLAKTVIVDTIESARAIAQGLLDDVTVVTRDGYLIKRNGIITGGSTQKMGGIISRKNEIDRLKAEFSEKSAEVAGLRENESEIADGISGVNGLIREIEVNIEDLNTRIGEYRKQLGKDERDLIHINEMINSVMGSIVSDGVRIEEIEEQLVADEGRFNWFGKLSELLEVEIGKLDQKAGELARKRDSLQKDISDIKIDLATTNGHKEIIAEKISHLNQNISEFRLEIEKDDQLIARLNREIEEGEQNIAAKRTEIEEKLKHLEEADSEMVELKNSAEEVRAEYDVIKSKYRSILGENKKQNEKLRDVEIRKNNLIHEKERIETSFLENHNLDIRIECENFTRPEGEIDLHELENEVKQLFTARSKITGADPTAIERLESVENQLEYMLLQKEDLDKARNALRNLINKINRESARKFTETFETIRENFKTLFRKLFGGGRADLILEPDKDELEAGVDIVCRPPGSQLQSISLLSGGQKAMVVISLLFSVLRSNPSPLCLLDEIDGPLDEANIDRFLSLVQEFMRESQFIIITHNKRTVSFGDIIYGITMQEVGVSKKLSLEFEDIRKDEKLLGKPEEEKVAG